MDEPITKSEWSLIFVSLNNELKQLSRIESLMGDRHDWNGTQSANDRKLALVVAIGKLEELAELDK